MKRLKRFFKLSSLAAVAAAFTISVLGGGQTKAISNGSNATQQYGAVSLWFPDSAGVNRHRCGASLISPFWAVTAAHCQPILVPGQTQVKVGGLNINTPITGPGDINDPSKYQEVGLAQVIVHPGYYAPPDDAPSVNDIALIQFQQPVTKQTEKLALPFTPTPVGAQGKVAGWGWTCDDQVPPAGPANCGLPFPNILQELTLRIAPDSRCTYMGDPQTELCALAASGKHAMACRGDSGSPFTRSVLQQNVLVGVVEGDGDAVIFHPNDCDENVNGEQGVSTLMDVSKYTPWILDTIFNLSKGNSAQMPQTVKL